MCLISVLPKGTPKYSDEVTNFIESGFQTNRDGSGYMYKKDRESLIHVNKGFFDFPMMMEALLKEGLKDSDELVIHHRSGTSGRVSAANTHPFVISKDHDEIVITDGITDKPAMVHNGVFSGLRPQEALNTDFSDTYAFVRYVMTDTLELLKSNPALFTKALAEVISWGKLCFLLPDRDLIMTGYYESDNGYFHSNNCYKNNKARDVGGSSCSVKKDKIGGTVSGANQSVTNSRKTSVVLDGNKIDINSFNATHFIYTLKNSANGGIKIFKNYDEEAIFNIFHTRIANTSCTQSITKEELASHYNYYPKTVYQAYYKEYVFLLENLTPSKNVFKDLYKTLYNNKKKNIFDTFTIKTFKVSRFTLINYFMSLVKNYMSDDSFYSQLIVTDFLDKSVPSVNAIPDLIIAPPALILLPSAINTDSVNPVLTEMAEDAVSCEC